MQITTIGLDIAKNVFQVHGIDAKEKVVARKQLRRSRVITFFKALPPCLIGMEACATAHYWARELTKLGRSRDWGRARVRPGAKLDASRFHPVTLMQGSAAFAVVANTLAARSTLQSRLLSASAISGRAKSSMSR